MNENEIQNTRETSCSFVIFYEKAVKHYESERSTDAFYSDFGQLNICSTKLTNRQGSVWLNREKEETSWG